MAYQVLTLSLLLVTSLAIIEAYLILRKFNATTHPIQKPVQAPSDK